MKKRVLLVLLLIVSIGFNIYLLSRENLPMIHSGVVGLSTDSVEWRNDQLGLEGVLVSLQDKSTNLKNAYQVFSISVRANLSTNRLECQFRNTLTLGSGGANTATVGIDGPFDTNNCQIQKFDPNRKTASFSAKGIAFSVVGNNATWQDKSGNGPVISVFERVWNGGKYR